MKDKESVFAILDSKDKLICHYEGLDDFSISVSANIPTEPQEGGTLMSYDKVRNPQEVSVSLIFGGNIQKQIKELRVLEQRINSTELFCVITPAALYKNMALVGLSMNRSNRSGGNLLVVDCTFQEVLSANLKRGKFKATNKKKTSGDKVDTGQQPNSFLADLTGASKGPALSSRKENEMKRKAKESNNGRREINVNQSVDYSDS